MSLLLNLFEHREFQTFVPETVKGLLIKMEYIRNTVKGGGQEMKCLSPLILVLKGKKYHLLLKAETTAK